ncbi:MAG: 30S ribosomal protein S9 [Candidatus Levybacteria bacterium]|nr:30S ribosomal protein S9 [Candidatus Levybacteria bacterium]
MAEVQKETTKTNNGKQKKDYIFAVGRRKDSVARVRLYETVKDGLVWEGTTIKKGDIIVNKKPISEYFSGETMRHQYTEPIRVINAQNKYTFTIAVTGGGKVGQLHATIHGIARSLAELDKKTFRPTLKKKGFLTRDPRSRERRMVGTGGKARRAKQSPKR